MSYSSIVVLTGAGVSAESGIRTFRASDGLWENHPVEDVATPEGYARNPALVQRFYNDRRRQLASVEPNKAHRVLAEFERQFSGDFLLVTQNVDDLHERAGSQNLIHMHGELLKVHCQDTGKVFLWDQDVTVETQCECCGIAGNLRPHIVWFGEMPLQMDDIYQALSGCDLFVSIGTSGNVYHSYYGDCVDSITQAALGASIAAVAAGRRCNGKVLIAGALLGTLPDLDVVINYGDDVSNTLKHRGFSHSLLILPVFSWLLAFVIHRFKPVSGWSFTRLWVMILTVLITHPLLDFFTSYGTQLTWPIPGYYALSSMFIIDPLYTLPLLVGIGFGLVKKTNAAKFSAIALVISTLYLGWSLVAQQMIKGRVDYTLQALGLPADKVFITPAPLTTVLWRVVAVDGNNYWEGFASLLDKDREVRFIRQPGGRWPLPEIPGLLADLQTFSHGFLNYREEDNRLLVSDLRMGIADNLAFQFQFAQRDTGGQWQLQTPVRYQGLRLDGDAGKLVDRLLGDQAIDARLGDCAQCTSVAEKQKP